MATSRIFFITDVHGSTRCFKKFLNSAKFYKANVLVLGGDITGKALIPLVDQEDGTFRCSFEGEELRLKSKGEAESLAARAADSGLYAQAMSRKEVGELSADPKEVTRVFNEAMVGRVREWVALAEERLGKSGVKCYISPGNDDIFAIDGVLSSSPYVVNPEERVVDLDGGHEMITLGYTNRTPWKSPREVDEDELGEKVERMASQVKDMKSAIFNVHVPPKDTLLDKAPMVDENLKVVVKANQVQMTSAGSSAVRKAIESHQPLLGIHGHIHESKGMVRIGRTLCANPGSEYGEGVLRGFLAQVTDDRIDSYMLTAG
ncbi:MAG: metallophosphoesterase [Nitrososphaerota archaeon]|nr:metallophosphoesterase [Nitrososphaerota archaeon]